MPIEQGRMYWRVADDPAGVAHEGLAYFVICERESGSDNPARWLISDKPLVSVAHREPILYGYGGEQDGVSRSAYGLGRVESVRADGRVELQRLSRQEVIPALEALGYPSLGVDDD